MRFGSEVWAGSCCWQQLPVVDNYLLSKVMTLIWFRIIRLLRESHFYSCIENKAESTGWAWKAGEKWPIRAESSLTTRDKGEKKQLVKDSKPYNVTTSALTEQNPDSRCLRVKLPSSLFSVSLILLILFFLRIQTSWTFVPRAVMIYM